MPQVTPPRRALSRQRLYQIASAIFVLTAAWLGTPSSARAIPGDLLEPAAGPHEIKANGRPSGNYWFDPDGPGPAPRVQGSYDADEGGGWLLVLNYVHKGGTNPPLRVRTDSLPRLRSSTLGLNEAGTAGWGHAAPSLLAPYNVAEIRFYAVTSHHERVIHFSTDEGGTIDYVKSGIGATITGEPDAAVGLNLSHTLLTAHTASIPQEARRGFSDQGDFALTEFPFWRGCCTWGIRGLNSEMETSVRWEVDDAVNDEPPGDQYHTIHRAWIRTEGECGNGLIEAQEACDDGNAEDGDGCSASCEVEDTFVCRDEPSSCHVRRCGDGFVDDEPCDDGGEESGNGCNPVCGVEHGFVCEGEPSLCSSECGDGLVARDESCDDGNLTDGDGCDASCRTESDWNCGGEPSECVERCDDGGQCVPKGDGDSKGCSVGSARKGAGPLWMCAALLSLVLVRRHPRALIAVALMTAMHLGTSTAKASPGDEDEPVAGPHQLRDLGRPAGAYWFDPDGTTGPIAPFLGDYNTEHGGGWLMVLNYVHQGGTNPELSLHTTDLPRLGPGTLGSDESATDSWGHATPTILINFQIDEFRFWGRSSTHERTLHFVTHDPATIDYFRTGEGAATGIAASVKALPDHSGNLLDFILGGNGNAGDFALTEMPFAGLDRDGNLIGWSIRGLGVSWSADDTIFGDSTGNHTMHRVWIRTAPMCGNGYVETDEQCDDGNTEDTDGCSATCDTEQGFVCLGEPSRCRLNVCGDGTVIGLDLCDDGNTIAGDGCNNQCRPEHGFICTGEPSLCESDCGDGLVARDEACDDGNNVTGDGCDPFCHRERGVRCGGEPSRCSCVDGELCDIAEEGGSSGCALAPPTAPAELEWLLLVLGLWPIGRRLFRVGTRI